MPLPGEATSEVTDKGIAIYNDKLKCILEPDHNNEYVVIHVDTGDYVLGRSFVAALTTIRRRREPGRLVGMKIGPEPDYALASRLLGS